jgi:hypothetical protein
MEIDSNTKEELIEFARSQMERRGEIDILIFTTKDIMTGLRKTSEHLDKAVSDVNQALHLMGKDPENE